ncbi:helix-turn-helix transcriptional regulator [Enterococcus sp. LJL128]|uniref:helix-turn-helix transcriptional regulator n=1 Tax=Enterococcus sp. LJL51 TaxID=3416656 RepID=UPI003CF5714E
MKKEQTIYEMMWYIQNKKEFTAQELADRFQLSIRSVYRYITDLADLGLYVESKKGRNGGFTVLANQVLPPVLFTENEIISLYFAIQSLANYEEFPFQMNTVTAGEKLLSVVPKQLQDKLLHLEDHFQLAVPKQVVENSFLSDLMAAAMNKQQIEIKYRSPQFLSVKVLEPIGIYAANGFWYLFAVDTARKEPRHYRIDRIQSVTVVAEQNQTNLTLKELNKEYEPKEPVKMLVELTAIGLKRCLENRYLSKGVLSDEKGRRLELTIDQRDIPYTAEYLIMLGREAVIKEPRELVEFVVQKLEGILEQYAAE